MSTIPIKSRLDLELTAILEGIAQLDNESLEKFAKSVNDILLNRKVPALSKKETTLLKKINQGIAIDKLNRFETLQVIMRKGKANKKEEKEFETLVNFIENKEAERLKNMILLSKLWKMTMPQLRKKLGITPPEPHVL